MDKMLVDQGCPLFATRAGRVLVVGQRVPEAEEVRGTFVVLLGEGGREALIEWLGRVEVAEAARGLGTCIGTISRGKRGLGNAAKNSLSLQDVRLVVQPVS